MPRQYRQADIRITALYELADPLVEGDEQIILPYLFKSVAVRCSRVNVTMSILLNNRLEDLLACMWLTSHPHRTALCRVILVMGKQKFAKIGDTVYSGLERHS